VKRGRRGKKRFPAEISRNFRGYVEKFCGKFVDFFKKRRIINIRMDTKRNRQMADAKALSVLSGKRTVVGAKQLRKALSAGQAKRVYLAANADPAITEPLEALCQLNAVDYAWVKSMTDLGHACGIEVGAAAAAALD